MRRVSSVDLDAVRTFVAAADAGQFQDAAAALSITQQAVSKRIAALEKDLEVRLFTRTPRGAQLTVDGQAFLPHARELLRVAARADASVRPGRRALRVDVHSRRTAPAVLLQDFHRTHPRVELDVVTLDADVHAAIAAVEAGTIDATFHAVTVPACRLPGAIRTARVIDERHDLLVGPRHPLANARAVTPAQLAEHRIWMPGMAAGTEWAGYYDELAAAFGLTIDRVGPVFGNEVLLAEIAGSAHPGHTGRRTHAVPVAGQLRPAAHTGARPGTGLPDVTDLARRQPASRPHRASRPPQRQTRAPTRREGVAAAVGNSVSQD